MSRKEQLRELQRAEVALADRRLLLHRLWRARVGQLQRVHPAWLLGGGFVSGVIAQRLAVRVAHSTFGASLLAVGLRLSRFVAGGIVSSLGQAEP